MSDLDTVDPFHNSDESDYDPDYLGETSDSESSANEESMQSQSDGEETPSNIDVLHVDEDTQLDIQQTKGKKRLRNPKTWKRSKNKLLRNTGCEYVTSKGKKVEAKKQGTRCQCKQKCFEKFTELERDKIFSEFYGMQEKNIQDAYLSSLIAARTVKKRRKCTKDPGQDDVVAIRNYTYTYTIKIGTKKAVVCRTAFCTLHAVHASRVQQIARLCASNTTLLKKDGRGLHNNRPNKMPDDILASVHEHISSFPLRQSHYSRSESKKKYLPAELNVKTMHEMYLEKYEPDQYRLLKRREPIKPKVSYDYYYRYFTEKFNISFGFPRSDTCSTCDTIQKQIEAVETEQEKAKLLQTKELHLRKAQAFYDDLKQKTQLALTDPTVETLCFDYQQNLPVPILTSSEIFYARQLWVFNQCFHSCSNARAVMYMFDETVAKKGCIETVSFLKHYIEKYLSKTVKTLYAFTDNCGGQNKNSVVLQFFMSLIKNGSLLKIVHHLPEPGHSFLPCDRNFGIIEKKKRKKELLYIPEEWYSLVETCGKNFVVERVSQDMILDMKTYLQQFFKKTAVVNKIPFAVSKYRIFIYDSDHVGKVLVTENHSVENIRGYVLLKDMDSVIDFNNAPLAYSASLPVNYKKYDSIMPLIKKYVPQASQVFYENLKRSHEQVDSD